MENNILFLFGIVVSCMVITIIIFQFLESRHKRLYNHKKLYRWVKVIVCLFFIGINLLQLPILNMICWIFVFGLVSYFLYFDDFDKPIQRVLDAVVMVLVFMVCETVGIVLLEFIFWKIRIQPLDPQVRTFFNMTFSMLVLLFFYYTVISRIWGKRGAVRFTRIQWILHMIIAVYSVMNMIIILEAAGRMKGEMASFILLVNMGFIVFADMYFLYFIQFVEESNQLKLKLKLLEQQADLQYKYYVRQEKNYRESVNILHDVDKHITAIEKLMDENNKNIAITYTKEISAILKPLIPQQLTNHPILNILLNDKIQLAQKANIDFQYKIENIDLSFMNPVDVTTIFENLINNAMEACGQMQEMPWIRLKINSYYEMIAISIENTSHNHCVWKNDMPVSQKGQNHGIGLSNVQRVLKKYDGTMHLSSANGIFQCNIILNR